MYDTVGHQQTLGANRAFHRWKNLYELTLVFGNLPRRCGTVGRPESHPQQTVSGLSKKSHRPELHVGYSNGENDRGSPTDFVPSTPLVSPSSGLTALLPFLWHLSLGITAKLWSATLRQALPVLQGARPLG